MNFLHEHSRIFISARCIQTNLGTVPCDWILWILILVFRMRCASAHRDKSISNDFYFGAALLARDGWDFSEAYPLPLNAHGPCNRAPQSSRVNFSDLPFAQISLAPFARRRISKRYSHYAALFLFDNGLPLAFKPA